MYRLRVISIILVITVGAHCTSTYSRNRFRDLADIVTLTIGSSVGASVRAGPLAVGAEINVGRYSAGLQGGYFGTFDREIPYIPAGTCIASIPGGVFSSISHQLVARKKSLQCILEGRNKAYRRSNFPLYQYGAVGFSAGILIIGIRFEINFLEILDLGAGLLGWDPLNDDDPAIRGRLFKQETLEERCNRE